MRLSDLDIRSLLPEAMRSDPANVAMAQVLSDYLASIATRAQVLRWWDAFANMTDIQLDACAVELKVSWYRAEMTREEKIAVLQDADWVWRHAGTKAAMETAFRTYFGDPDLYVSEWDEFGGQWGEFQVHTALSESRETGVKFRDVLRDVSRVGWRLANVLHQFSGKGPVYIGAAVHEIEHIEFVFGGQWAVWITNNGSNKVNAIKALREVFNYTLAEAKVIVDAADIAPALIDRAIYETISEANATIEALLATEGAQTSPGIAFERRLYNGV